MHWPAYTGLSLNSLSPSAAEHSLPPLCLSAASQVLPILVDNMSSSSAATTVCKSPSRQSESSTLCILIRIPASTMLHKVTHSSSIRSVNTRRVIFLLFPEVPGGSLNSARKKDCASVVHMKDRPIWRLILRTPQISCYYLTGVKFSPFPAATGFRGYRWKKSKLTPGFLTPFTVHTPPWWSLWHPCHRVWDIRYPSLPYQHPHSASRRTQSAVTSNSEKW